jgi:flagellar biosynthetic protein FliQ
MNAEFIIGIAGQAVSTILKVIVPVLSVALIVGLTVSILQATTQIQEQTLSFIPKIIAVFISLVFFGPWLLSVLVDFAYNILNNLHLYIG